MSEHTQIFENGTWVKGNGTDGENFDFALVTGFDPEDGEHAVTLEPEDLVALTKDNRHAWCRPDDIEATDPPEWVGGGTEHVFVIDWIDDGVANVQLFAAVEDVQEALGDPEDPDPNVQLKLMEAVADPGERVELPLPGYGVRFTEVVGNER